MLFTLTTLVIPAFKTIPVQFSLLGIKRIKTKEKDKNDWIENNAKDVAELIPNRIVELSQACTLDKWFTL